MRHRLVLALGIGLLLGGPRLAAAGAAEEDEALLRAAGVPADGPALLDFFRSRTLDGTDGAQIKALVRQLGDDAFTVREQASRKLVAIGPRAREVLRAALSDPDPEIVHRAGACLAQIREGDNPVLLAAAVRVLGRRRPARAVDVLLQYLPSAEEETVAHEVRAVLDGLAVQEGKADPALVAALADATPARRAAAGSALARAGLAEHRVAVRKLLADPDPRVRLRVGLALAAARDKEAVSALIPLLDRLPAEETGLIEDLLYRLAGDKAPAEAAGADAPARRRYREAWEAWWKQQQARIDPAALEKASRTLGFTLVVLLDAGQVIDLDGGNRPRWQVGGLMFPLDVQLLPGDERILVAEHRGNRVTERDLQGRVLWEYAVPGPLAAQRLRNGNTFITTRERLLEVNRLGAEVFSYTRPTGELFMKAQKLPNGDIACVTQLGVGVARYVRLSPGGGDYQDVRSFGVHLMTSGGRIDVLPNGHVLVPEKDNNRVAEYGPNGRLVHEIHVDEPVAALRLPNGNTLVTLMSQQRAVELTRAGKEVWQYRGNTRVTRAYRR
jgi:HEAT repeat protein